MTVQIVVDMNLSPEWVPALTNAGYPAVHWATIGDPRATDREITQWAKQNGYVILTHDLDFGAILAATNARFPSVLQVRSQDTMPEVMAPAVIRILEEYRSQLLSGALVVFNQMTSRVRILPIHSDEQ